ncbi:hypothetical protein DFH11DRAFT_1739320 [Phellopilus nigrolimitatus]|nr:hypothetical protein DFH11DRAFT_1739320 [Phellopilus nigrolimitatus]
MEAHFQFLLPMARAMPCVQRQNSLDKPNKLIVENNWPESKLSLNLDKRGKSGRAKYIPISASTTVSWFVRRIHLGNGLSKVNIQDNTLYTRACTERLNTNNTHIQSHLVLNLYRDGRLESPPGFAKTRLFIGHNMQLNPTSSKDRASLIHADIYMHAGPFAGMVFEEATGKEIIIFDLYPDTECVKAINVLPSNLFAKTETGARSAVMYPDTVTNDAGV